MAFTQQSGRNAWYEDQILTRAAPTTSTADGVALPAGLDSLTVVVEAPSGQTIDGGSIRGYASDELVAAWFRVAELDKTISPTGVRRAAFNFVISGLRPGMRFMWASDSITLSGAGTTVRVYILGGLEEADD